MLRAQTETVILVPSGTYTFAQILTQSGTAANVIRYRPAVPGGVIIRGGAITGKHYMILDGFTVDARLDLGWPAQSHGIDVQTSDHVTITHTEVIGPTEIHTGFDISGTVSCDESTGRPAGFPTTSGGIGTRAGTDWITFDHVTVHGFYGLGSFRGNHDRLTNSLLRNNFNGLGISSIDLEMVDNVFWQHPNHLLSLEGAKRVVMSNNLVVDAADVFNTGSGRAGVDDVSIVHNTFWIPANKPCYGLSGPNLTSVRKAVVTDNLTVTKQDGFLGGSDLSIPVIASDYNLFFGYVPTTQQFIYTTNNQKVPLAAWRTRTGQDLHSVIVQPQFVNAPQYLDMTANPWGFRIPTSADEARAWLSLVPCSPGKNAASDGRDQGMDVRLVR